MTEENKSLFKRLTVWIIKKPDIKELESNIAIASWLAIYTILYLIIYFIMKELLPLVFIAVIIFAIILAIGSRYKIRKMNNNIW